MTQAQYSGWACCWCGRSLREGGVSAGIARGRIAAHVLDIEVYACPPGVGCGPLHHTKTPAPAGESDQELPAWAGHPHPQPAKEISNERTSEPWT
ncbi:hypothetical protein [Streptomyces sp. NPDC000851]